MGNIYDGAFRTILNDCRKLIIPVINDIFDEHYTGEEEIRFSPNEHFLESIILNVKVAYQMGRLQSGFSKMKYVIVTPGGTVQYDVPIMKVQSYSLDEIFEKRLLMLIPFYIFSHEKSFSEYNNNELKLEELKAEYRIILERLDDLEKQGIISAFDKRTIIELSSDVIREIARKYENVQKGIGATMRGLLIQTEAGTILNRGISENKKETALRMLKVGKLTVEEIAEYTALSVAEVEQLANLQTV